MLFTIIITVCTIKGAQCDNYAVDTSLTYEDAAPIVQSYLNNPIVNDVVLQPQYDKD